MGKAAHHANKAMDKTADKLETTASSMRKTDFKSKTENASDAMNDTADDLNSKFSSAKHNSRP
jgi:ABC-type transporter Mla subunit MlaD